MSLVPKNELWHIGMISDMPKRVLFQGKEYALWSADKRRFVLQPNICPHNSFPVMGGGIEGDVRDGCLVCPFHGGRFTEAGELLHPHSNTVSHRGIPRLPVIEEGGDLWTQFGAEVNISPPQLEYGQMFYRYRKIVKAPRYRMVQVAMDLMHVQYVHAKTFGKRIREVRVDHDSLIKENRFGKVGLSVEHSSYGTMEMEVSFYFPGVVVIEHFLQTTVILVRPTNDSECYTEARIYPKLEGPFSGMIYLMCKSGLFEWRLPMVILEDEMIISQIASGNIFQESLFEEDVLWRHFRGILKESLNA